MIGERHIPQVLKRWDSMLSRLFFLLKSVHVTPPFSSSYLLKSNLILLQEQMCRNSETDLLWNLNQNFLREIIIGIMGVPFLGVHLNHLEPTRMELKLGGLLNFFLNYCKTLIHAADKGKFSLQICQQ